MIQDLAFPANQSLCMGLYFHVGRKQNSQCLDVLMLSKHVAQCQHFPSRAPCLVRSLPGPRTCLLIYLITAMGGVWILEQPRSSLVSWHPRIRLLWKSIPKAPKSKPILWTNAWEHMLLRSFMNNHYFGSLCCPLHGHPWQVWQAAWWAAHYRAPTPKRHICWANSPAIVHFDMGTLSRVLQKELAKKNNHAKPTETYSSGGKKRFKGTKHLRATGPLPQLSRNQTVTDSPLGPNMACYLFVLELRNYTPMFGVRVTRLHSRFLSTRAPLPPISQDVLDLPVKPFFAHLPWVDLWEDGNIREVIFYLRGCETLNLGDWKDCFPAKL